MIQTRYDGAGCGAVLRVPRVGGKTVTTRTRKENRVKKPSEPHWVILVFRCIKSPSGADSRTLDLKENRLKTPEGTWVIINPRMVGLFWLLKASGKKTDVIELENSQEFYDEQ